MADTRWRKLRGDLRAARGRLLLVTAAIALAYAGAAALFDTWLMVRSATERGYLASAPVSATLTLERVDEAVLAQARAFDGIAGVRARRFVLGSVRTGASWTRAVFHAYDAFERTEIGRLAGEQGEWPPRPGEIAIEHSSLELAGAVLGDTLLFSVPGSEPKPLRFGAVVRDVSQAPGWMEHAVYAYATTETLATLGAEPGFDELEIRVRDGDADRDAVRGIAYALKAALERAGHAVRDVDVPVPNQHVHAAQMNSLSMTQGAFAALTLLVALFLVVNLMHALLARQVREIG
jgi:putative ABC transport system permease protein